MDNSLAKVDPAWAWEAAPLKNWNLKWAAHLFRRAGFGMPPKATSSDASAWELLRQATQKGRDEAIEALFSGANGQAEFNSLLDEIGSRIAATASELEKMQGWWLYRMLYTPHPLLERCTIFWHNHFATSAAKVRDFKIMFAQNQTLRSHAMGDFKSMLLAMGRDPAMLVWLDSNSNIKGKPNENYAREVMELFSLGVGNYTEKDIQEAARAFTGRNTSDGKFQINAQQHDNGPKTVLGQTGNWNGDDIVRILLEQKTAARFLVRKLFREFVNDTQPPPDRLLDPLADRLRQSHYDVSACLRTMLQSNIFYSEHAYRQRIKSPVEYIVGLLRSFDARVSVEHLASSMEGLGQLLFAPPNVKGWDGGKAWLNSATLLARHNLAWRLVGGRDSRFRGIDPATVTQKNGGKKPAGQVDFLLKLLLQADINSKAREKLIVEAKKLKPEDISERSTVKGPNEYTIIELKVSPFETKTNASSSTSENPRERILAHTIILMPEYQLA